VDDEVLSAFASAIPKQLTKLGLDLNHVSSRDAQVLAKALPASLRQLRILFHGRSFAWLGTGSESGGAEELASALPAGLERLHLMMESSHDGAVSLCKGLPKKLQHLALDLHLVANVRRPPGADLLQALTASVPRLRVLQLRLTDMAVTLEGLRNLSEALSERLLDLRLDLCCRDVGDEGAAVLSSKLPRDLERLALCLRDWRFTDVGAQLLADALPCQIKRLKFIISNSPIGAVGVRALALSLPPRLSRLNLSLRHCSIGRTGEQALRPLARKWNEQPSWVRVCEKSPACLGLHPSAEWEIWDE